MRTGIGCLAGILALTAAGAALDETGSKDPAVSRVMARNPIHISATGRAAVPFPAIAEGLTRTNLIVDLQRTYARMLPAGRQPEFVILQTSSNAYHYSNPEGEQSDIREISRQHLTPDCIRCVYHVAGRRFFGTFESVIQVDARKAEAAATGYEVEVYAHPDVGLARFLARHLPFVEGYFRRKTREIVGLMAEIVKASVTERQGRAAEPPLAMADERGGRARQTRDSQRALSVHAGAGGWVSCLTETEPFAHFFETRLIHHLSFSPAEASGLQFETESRKNEHKNQSLARKEDSVQPAPSRLQFQSRPRASSLRGRHIQRMESREPRTSLPARRRRPPAQYPAAAWDPRVQVRC